jgi:hypothetical protein
MPCYICIKFFRGYLIIDRGGVLYGLEVKATVTPTPRHADGVAHWLDLAGPGARGMLRACSRLLTRSCGWPWRTRYAGLSRATTAGPASWYSGHPLASGLVGAGIVG